MFFIASKTLGPLSIPSHALALAAVVGILLLWTRFRCAGRRILACCLVVFIVVGVFPVGQLLIVVLEERFPVWTNSAGPPDGIIVLGGPILPGLSLARGHTIIRAGAERLTELPALARRFPNARIVFSGGNANLIGHGPPEAQFAVPLLESFGIAPERIAAEDRSRDTWENAVFTKALVHPKAGERWLLVTSAAHMPRAVGAFRKAGFPVEAYPVDWHSDGKGPSWRWLKPSLWWPSHWGAMDDAAKEWVGLMAYWLSGRSSDLFPAPEHAPPSSAATAPSDKRP